MRPRLFSFILMLINCIFIVYGMEYGLHFNSHSYPVSQRTSLKLGDSPFEFEDEFSIGFDIGFYGKDKFGLICSILGNDGTSISLVSSPVDDTYHPALVINNVLHTIPVELEATVDNPIRPIIILKRHENNVIFVFNKERYSFPLDMGGLKSVSVTFGMNAGQKSVAPIEICDIRIFTEKKNTHKWELRTHEGSQTIDDLSGVIAVTENPHWIIDDHIFWNKIYDLKSSDRIQTAFNPDNSCFYIVSSSDIIKFNPLTSKSEVINLNSDGRVMKYSNYLFYDTISNGLLSYNLARKDISRFNNSAWSISEGFNDEPKYANHGFTSNGQYAYMFGGYGFYIYNNTLYRLNLTTEIFEEFTLSPLPDPRTSSSLCIHGDKLYLFGGLGNTVGKQEIPTKHYFDLWEYDLKTFKGRKIWETDTISYDFLPSSTMYYVPKDSAFYLASTLYGGCMMKISINSPTYEVVSKPILSKMDFRDCVFNLYQGQSGKNYYLVIDKRLDDNSHDYAIYTICYPFSDNLLYDTSYRPSDNNEIKSWIYIISVILTCIIIAIILIRRNLSTKGTDNKESNKSVQENTDDENNIEYHDDNDINSASTESASENVTVAQSAIDISINDGQIHHDNYNRELSSISFLGRFDVKDKNGNDITTKFTSRIKDLLILLVLSSEQDEKGVSYQKLDEEIWFDKVEKSAKNNRNVYMRKLRLLLEEVGNAEIIYEKGYYRLNCNDVCIDYHHAIGHLKLSNSGPLTTEQLEETIELMLKGPLLPDTHYEWLDEYKSKYTDMSLKVLYKLLEHKYQKGGNLDQAYRLAETIMRHDQLNEEALTIMCKILYTRKMKGSAKTLYDNFCREFKKSFGEEYHIQFSDIFKS